TTTSTTLPKTFPCSGTRAMPEHEHHCSCRCSGAVDDGRLGGTACRLARAVPGAVHTQGAASLGACVLVRSSRAGRSQECATDRVTCCTGRFLAAPSLRVDIGLGYRPTGEVAGRARKRS